MDANRRAPVANQPLVSIVSAVRNDRAGLERTLKSVALQRGASFEHIIVDGGSDDGTVALLEGQRGATWISETDRGIADAMNKGIGLANGRYVLFLHAGDTFRSETSLRRVCEVLDGADIVSFSVVMREDGRDRLYRTKGFSRLLHFFMTVPHQGAFCRKDLFERIGGFRTDIAVAMDYEFMLRAKRAGASLVQHDQWHTIMPADGISSRRDSASLTKRLLENKRVQELHPGGILQRLTHRFFWKVYPSFKLFRHRHAGPLAPSIAAGDEAH